MSQFDNRILSLHKMLHGELSGKLDGLDKVLNRIVELQQKKSRSFEIGVNLFKELNGLGTFYLVGINDKRG